MVWIFCSMIKLWISKSCIARPWIYGNWKVMFQTLQLSSSPESFISLPSRAIVCILHLSLSSPLSQSWWISLCQTDSASGGLFFRLNVVGWWYTEMSHFHLWVTFIFLLSTVLLWTKSRRFLNIALDITCNCNN